MSTYVCAELERATNIYGGKDCDTWVEQPSNILDELAITKESAAEITVAICILLVMAYVGGLIGRAMLQV